MNKNNGLSVIICCHNSAVLLPNTLLGLKTQAPPPIPWEVVLIDNASSDRTAAVARDYWEGGPVPLRVVSEPQLGTRHARERGLREAHYELIGFIDDDNWVESDWVWAACQVMAEDPEIGAASSIRLPTTEIQLPSWFEGYHGIYAVMTPDDLDGMEGPPSHLPTAGLCLRAAAYHDLVRDGFHSLLAGRVGQNLSGGEDTELTTALRLRGWKLVIDRRMRMRHYLPSRRLKWCYLRRFLRSADASTVLLDAYTDHSLMLEPGPRSRLSDWWLYQAGRRVRWLVAHPGPVLTALRCTAEGRAEVIEVERTFGRLLGFLRTRGRYGAARRMMRVAPWIPPRNRHA